MLKKKFQNNRDRRKYRQRFKIRGNAERPRLNVYRSNKHIYAQVIDDDAGHTLASASTLEPALQGFEGNKVARAQKVGELLCERALAAGVSKLVFDRNGFRFMGRVAAVAKAAHEANLLTTEGVPPKEVIAAVEADAPEAAVGLEPAPAEDAAETENTAAVDESADTPETATEE
jgi:large subunit ribosomal protein L18